MNNMTSSPGASEKRPNSLPLGRDGDDESLRHSIAMNEDGTPRDKTFFDKTLFLKEHPGDFYETLCSTQMFSVFMREQLTCPDQSEIKFFTEAIVDKRNRSKKTLVKLSTPFLSDRRDAITKTYVPPYPLRTGLAPGSSFSYSVFPDIKPANFAPKRDIPKLVEGPELARLLGSVTNKFKSSILASNAHAKLLLEKEQREGMEESIKIAKDRYARFIRGVTLFQACTRMRGPRLTLLRKLEAAGTIQRAYKALRNYRITRLSGAKKFQCSILIQAQIRGCLGRMHYRRMRVALAVISKYQRVFVAVSAKLSALRKLRRLQLFYRRRFLKQKWRLQRGIAVVRKAVKKFLRLLKHRRQQNAAIRIQALVRGHVCYLKLGRDRFARLTVMREVLVVLWRLDNTKLSYRSNFWVLLGSTGKTCTNFSAKLHELELCRLWADLGFYGSLLNKRNGFSSHLDTVKGLILRPADLASRVQRSAAEATKRAAALKDERALLYRAMKNEADDHLRMVYFEKFGIASAKKRKQTLADRVWAEGNSVDDSAAAVRSILAGGAYEDTQWLQAVRAERLQADVLSVASALLYRVQNSKQRRNRRSSLISPVPTPPSTGGRKMQKLKSM